MKKPLNKVEILALRVTENIGSVTSVIIHTILFFGAFMLILFGFDVDRVLLVLTTIVSLEAIYLSIFIQLSVNYQGRAIENVEKDIDEISQDVEEIAEDIDEIQGNVEDIAGDVEDLQEGDDDINQQNVTPN
jgi:hypothetical protein